MVYKVVGLMSGSSLDGIDIAFVNLQETAGRWQYELVAAECYSYPEIWKKKLQEATSLSSLDYQFLHSQYGHYLGQTVTEFIKKYELQHQVALISSHGHTTFHEPGKMMTHQLGNGAAIAAETGLAVVSDLRALDVAFGGQGAPIIPVGEKLLFDEYELFLNLGGIANISARLEEEYIAFDVCPANRVLNMLASLAGLDFDNHGNLASQGKLNQKLLTELNELRYYKLEYPKSLSNDFGTAIVYPIITKYELNTQDALATYVEHIAMQIYSAINSVQAKKVHKSKGQLFVTGGGAFNGFLIERLQRWLSGINIEIIIPSAPIVKFKEALVMALLGLLRWREENTVLSSVTGAKRDSIGGALWLGT